MQQVGVAEARKAHNLKVGGSKHLLLAIPFFFFFPSHFLCIMISSCGKILR